MQKAQLLVRIFQTFLFHSSKYISNRHSSLLYLVFLKEISLSTENRCIVVAKSPAADANGKKSNEIKCICQTNIQ